MHSIKLPDILWAAMPRREAAMLMLYRPNTAIDYYAWMLERPTRVYISAFRSYPRGES